MTAPEINHKLSLPDSLESLLKVLLISPDSTREQILGTVQTLSAQGWTRKRFYDLCRYINHNEHLDEEEQDRIGDFMTGLDGNVHPASIIRLIGEPEEEEAFLKYVYSNDWMS